MQIEKKRLGRPPATAVERSACETPDASGQSQAEIPHGVLKPTQQAIADRHGLASRTVAQKYSIAKALPEGMLDAISDIEGCSLDAKISATKQAEAVARQEEKRRYDKARLERSSRRCADEAEAYRTLLAAGLVPERYKVK